MDSGVPEKLNLLVNDQFYLITQTKIVRSTGDLGDSWVLECPELELSVTHGNVERAAELLKEAIIKFLAVDGKSRARLRVERFMRLMRRAALATNDSTIIDCYPDFGLPLREWTSALRILRAKIMLEEMWEMIMGGLGVDIEFSCFGKGSMPIKFEELNFIIAREPSLLSLADGAFDVGVMVDGTLAVAGILDSEGRRVVDEANLRKVGSGFHFRSDGKGMKPPGWVGPEAELTRLLESVGAKSESESAKKKSVPMPLLKGVIPK